MINRKITYLLTVFLVCVFFHSSGFLHAQEPQLEQTVDAAGAASQLPKVFRPNIDLSGRGLNSGNNGWPQMLAAKDVLSIWHADIGFKGIYRIQFNLWEIDNYGKSEDIQDELLENYENIIKTISDSGGVVILDLFSTPAGLGKVLDKKSTPQDIKAFKGLVKSYIKKYSCDKRYNIWYEVWTAPDLDSFFLGRTQEYLNLYKAVAEAVKELENESKIHIPIGGPSVSWWFQDVGSNNIMAPEKSLVYELIKFCYRYKLPLDFISWHAYSTDPHVENETTLYNKSPISLVRAWLSYFHFDPKTPLIVDEWNFDSGYGLAAERQDKAYIGASYIPARIKKMHALGLDYQLFFALEDFYNPKEGVARNLGIFSFDPANPDAPARPKATYNVFRMLSALPGEMLNTTPLNDEFVGMVAARSKDKIVVIVYNYIDPDITRNYLSRNLGSLVEVERRFVLKLISSGQIDKILYRQQDVLKLKTTNRVKSLLTKAQELNDVSKKYMISERVIKLNFKNLKGDYFYQRYAVDSSCGSGCPFLPVEEKDIPGETCSETLALKPYSVNMVVLSARTKAEVKQEAPAQAVPPSTEAPAPPEAKKQE